MKIFHRLLAAGAIVAVFTPLHAAPVDLNTWSAESYNSVPGFPNGQWNVSVDGTSVIQVNNGQPTLFLSDFLAQGTEVTGKISVGGSDDDFIGFVLGYSSGDNTSPSADYLLVDWKRGTQSFDFGQPNDGPGGSAPAGLAVTRVTGVPVANEFWTHDDYVPNTDGTVLELARAATLGATGWSRNTEYEFSFDFGPNNLVIEVDGVEQFNLTGSFNNGSLGFYNFSQADVTYSAFEQDEGSFPAPVPLPAGGLMLLAAAGLLTGLRRKR